MNHKYRMKPLVIEAFQMTQERRADNTDWPDWLNQAWQKNHTEIGSLTPAGYPCSDGTDQLLIHTVAGFHDVVGWDDWIIRDVTGEFRLCKPDIFAATFEEVR